MESVSITSATTATTVTPKVFKRRWIILLAFCLLSMQNAFQWNQFASITNVITQEYSLSSSTVDYMALVYMFVYIPFAFPANWMLDRVGLLPVVVTGSCLNALGATIKLMGARSFYIMLFGQTVSSFAQIFVLAVPARLAGVWFGQNEVSRATSFGVFGNQIGIALGFLLPPVFVPQSNNEEIYRGIINMLYFTSGTAVLILLFVLSVFQSAPKVPPSLAQSLMIEKMKGESYFNDMKKFLSNINFLMLMTSYGINVGVFYGLSTILNEELGTYFQDQNENIGRIGLLVILAGMVGAVIGGYLLDKTHKFKILASSMYVFSFGLMVTYTFCLPLQHLWLMFIVCGLLGFFMTGYMPIGFEFGVEITHPLSEGTSAGLLSQASQVFGIMSIFVSEALIKSGRFNNQGLFHANIFLCAELLLGVLLTIMIGEKLHRKTAEVSQPQTEKQVMNEKY